ncbi:MAG: pseudouridine synthase [Pseudomonadales bacterium]|nr:pseudouridine synthase [Pseudomonadales bacterium]
MLIRFHKPYGVLCQFTSPDGRPCLGDFIDRPGVYAAGRLDFDSEGLVLLTDDGALQARISDPRHKLPKTYHAQVEARPDPVEFGAAAARLREGVELRDGPAHAVAVRALDPPELPAREPPVTAHRAGRSSWVEIVLTEGRNRQVRRMLAAVGMPVLRLVRVAIGPVTLEGLEPGTWAALDVPEGLRARVDRPGRADASERRLSAARRSGRVRRPRARR